MAKRKSTRTPRGSDNQDKDYGGSGSLAAPPELVIVTRPEAALRAPAGVLESLAGESTNDLEAVLADHGARLRPILGPTEERVFAAASAMEMAAEGPPAPDLSVFYGVDAPPERLEALRSDLESQGLVESAYIKPGAEPAAFMNDMAPAPEEAPPGSPDFSARQLYLPAAPGGVDALFAWTQAGGGGAGVRIIDIEGAWRFTHEDLAGNQGGVVGGVPSADIRWRNHGTAVMGEFGGDRNGVGVTGISPDANVSAISVFGPGSGSSVALVAAAARLRAGDVILIELHRPGPRLNFGNRDDQRGYIAIEWWPDDFAAILAATTRGIIVVEAAGNGAENLDDAIYQNPAPGFPPGWSNPFRRSNRDSGAIVVGAGAPPPGTHGRNHGADRSRLDFSNFGALIDAQGWGREVTTTGYGDLQGGTNEDAWYTDTFSGTSSASPIVVGVVASIQGMARARGRPVLTPAQIRNCLRTTGSPQQDQPGRPATQRIGNRPNLRQLVTCAFPPKLTDIVVSKDIKDRTDVIKGKEIIKDTKDNKDNKDRKDADKTKEVFKDTKDNKDNKDRKDADKTKEVLKDTKDNKDNKDRKDADKTKEILKDTKDNKDNKDRKDADKTKEVLKDSKDNKDRSDKPIEGPGAGGQPYQAGAEGGQIEERLTAVEQAVNNLVHFIGQELRPDLSASALRDEAQDLAQGDAEAKAWKDQTDC